MGVILTLQNVCDGAYGEIVYIKNIFLKQNLRLCLTSG